MINKSAKTKFIFLTTQLILLMGLVGGVEIYGNMRLVSSLNDIGKKELPAVRNMTLIDMMHDGLRAVVFRSLYVAKLNDQEQKKEIAEELKEFSEKMVNYLNEINQLELQNDINKSIEEAKPHIINYVKQAEEVTAIALSGHYELANQKLDGFQKAFKDLEEKLDVLGELIEKNAHEKSVEGVQFAERISIISKIIVLFGILLGTFLSIYIIRETFKSLQRTISQLSITTKEVSMASGNTASSSVQLSEAATEQASSLQQTMASAEEISAMVNQNAESAAKTQSVVETNQHSADEGSKSVADMMTAMTQIKDANEEILSQMESSNKEFKEIVRIISEIGEKTNVINEIVFQTKLLSFNASVEAARAGEHGKGFAVVAEEVGNLAQMSGNAAKEIKDMLTDSIKNVNSIVENTKNKVDHLMEVGRDKIAMGQSTAQKCQNSLSQITENARVISSMINEIALASKEQAQGVQEINRAITQLDQVTQTNSKIAQSSSTQADELNKESQTLSKTVSELIRFFFGNSNSLFTQLNNNPENALTSQKSVNINKSKGKLIDFQQSKNVSLKKKEQGKSKKYENTSPPKNDKVASGEESLMGIPSSDHPGFEDF